MSDKVFPSVGPVANRAVTGACMPMPVQKPPGYHPIRPSRPPVYNTRHLHRHRRGICCRLCSWAILIIFVLLVLVGIAGAVWYVLYQPRHPLFSLPSVRVHRLNFTTAADSTSHISTLLNFTFTARNPNSHMTFSFDPFTISSFADDVYLGNGSLPGFTLSKKNETSFRNVVAAGSVDLDPDVARSIRADLRRKQKLSLRFRFDSEVSTKSDGLKLKIGIRITCEKIEASPPKPKTPTFAGVNEARCKANPRVKIWRWTF